MADYKNTDQRYTSDPVDSPYLKAKQEWDSRIGSARAQALSWRIGCLISLAAIIGLIAIIIVMFSKAENHVYVAKVDEAGAVINVASLDGKYTPKDAEYRYFLQHFVNSIISVSLDPVLMQKQWKDAYGYVSGKGVAELTAWAKDYNPFSLIGKKTVMVNVTDITKLSKNSYQIRWTRSEYDQQGKKLSKTNQEGMFITTLIKPKTQNEIFINPLGIRIVDFNIQKVGDGK